MSDDTEQQITGDDLKNLSVSYNGTDTDFSLTCDDEKFTVTNFKEFSENKVYILKAEYDGFTCNFDIHLSHQILLTIQA